MKSFDKITIEMLDILKEMDALNKKIRDVALEGSESEKEIRAYDIGVKNTMSALKSLIADPDGSYTDRLIFQREMEQSPMRRFMLLSTALSELYGGD